MTVTFASLTCLCGAGAELVGKQGSVYSEPPGDQRRRIQQKGDWQVFVAELGMIGIAVAVVTNKFPVDSLIAVTVP